MQMYYWQCRNSSAEKISDERNSDQKNFDEV